MNLKTALRRFLDQEGLPDPTLFWDGLVVGLTSEQPGEPFDEQFLFIRPVKMRVIHGELEITVGEITARLDSGESDAEVTHFVFNNLVYCNRVWLARGWMGTTGETVECPISVVPISEARQGPRSI